jgi:hypothetical protein
LLSFSNPQATSPLPHKKNKKSQDDSVNSHISESDENNEKIQQQEATPTQLKSDKETTTPKQKITEDDKKNIKDTDTPPIQAPQLR